MWAELGTPQAQTDGAIVKYYREAPEQLGLHEEDIARLRAKKDKLESEKKNREKRLRELKDAVEALWEKLGVEERERKAFLNANRGCGVRQINEFDDELARLNELKRQNLHLFVEDARCKLQELWDALYFAEDEMLEFTPAFSDVYSDALLEAHEQEIERLETLREQRAPTLALVERHRSLIAEREELEASSQDASRLLAKGQKGERRDPGKLLREEKMRKRIAKELPKVTTELRKTLEQWEDEWGRPFYVRGERYLDILDAQDRPAPGPRSRTPANSSMPSRTATTPRSVPPVTRSNSVVSTTRSQAPSRAGANTPTTSVFSSLPTKRGQLPPTSMSLRGSPTKIGSPTKLPARAPLSNLKHVNETTNRLNQELEKPSDTLRRSAVGSLRAPPPRMRDLNSVPEPLALSGHFRHTDIGSGVARQASPENVYDDRRKQNSNEFTRPSQYVSEYDRPSSHNDFRGYPGKGSFRYSDDSPQDQRFTQSFPSQPKRHSPQIRQVSSQSTNSNGTVITGSENWETYDDFSEPEEDDGGEMYLAKIRPSKTSPTYVPAEPYARYNSGSSSSSRQLRGIPPAQKPQVMVDEDGNRIFSGSEWTDEDGIF